MIYFFISFRFLAERIIFPYFDTISFIANQGKRKICYFGFHFLFPKGGREKVPFIYLVREELLTYGVHFCWPEPL